MASDDEWLDEYRARIKALQQQQEQEKAELSSAASEPAVGRKGGALRAAVIFGGVLSMAVILVLTGMTMIRWAGDDFGDAERVGTASVSTCTRHGPISGNGLGYWETCDVTVRWDDGTTESLTKDNVFTSADAGQAIRVGDLGFYRASRELARADTPYRAWLKWIGVPLVLVGALPLLLAFLIVREHLRDRFRRLFRRG